MLRLKELRKEKKISQQQLADVLKVTQATISGWEAEKFEIDNASLNKIADYFNVSIDYLLGRSEKIDTLNISGIEPLPVTKKVPLLGNIACGEPILAEENIERYVDVADRTDCDFALRCKGDSMIGARILDGDLVFIKQQPMVENGEIAAVLINCEATLKRVYYYPERNKLVLNAENPQYEPLVYAGTELDEIRIIGKAVAFQSKVV